MTLLYFTSTGNCLYLAKRLGGMAVSIPQAMREGRLSFSDEAIGVVFPVYGLCVPPIVREFLQKAKLRCGYLFAVATYGFYAGAVLHELTGFAEAESLHFDYLNTLKMTENYLPGFAMEKQKPSAEEEKSIRALVQDVGNRREFLKKESAADRFLTWTHEKHYAYDRGIGVAGDYTVEDTCRDCGICAELCPTKNIRMVDGRPHFGGNCLSCLACTQNCPRNAIRLKTEKSRERYRNPNISLEELITSET